MYTLYFHTCDEAVAAPKTGATNKMRPNFNWQCGGRWTTIQSQAILIEALVVAMTDFSFMKVNKNKNMIMS